MVAPYDRWVLFGKLMEGRRHILGYTYRYPAFERERGVNRRLAADIEKAAPKRVNHFSEGKLRQAAHGYQVAYESVLALLRGETDDLVPASPAAAPDEPDDWTPPMSDPARIAAARRYYDEIKGRLDLLRARGVAEPSGRQLFPDAPADAKTWDGVGARLPIGDRVWLIADLRRRDDGRAGDSGKGATGS